MVRPRSFLPGPTIWGEMVFSQIWGEKWGREKIDGKSKCALPIFNLQPLLFIYFLYSINFFSFVLGA